MSALSALAADYGSSSSSESDSDCDTENVNIVESIGRQQHDNVSKLPPPEFGSGSHLSVFSNPFVEAENAKKAILEKHVKMTPTREETTMINGKRICWNYRKGRCRFGHKCKFAHDSDLHGDVVNDKEPEVEVVVQAGAGGGGGMDKGEEEEEENVRRKKKRPGLGDSIVPGKRVMKMYKKTATK